MAFSMKRCTLSVTKSSFAVWSGLIKHNRSVTRSGSQHLYTRLLSHATKPDTDDTDYHSSEASPQGVQGDDCTMFRLWQENCRRYGFDNCMEQLEGIQTGRKSLSQVFAEQQLLIEEIAKNYYGEVKQHDTQGIQDHCTAFPSVDSSCPQGVQGEDCIRYKLWLENCHRVGLQDCMENYAAFKTGRKTLAQIFSEQDEMIRAAVKKMKLQSRNFSTSTRCRSIPTNTSNTDANKHSPLRSIGVTEKSTEDPTPTPTESVTEEAVQLSQKERLKRAVKEYGSTVIVFHITISLASLGFFYLLVSSGLDVAGFLLWLDIGGEALKSKLAAGTGTFVIAYAVHKVFAPVRIATTLTATPFIVRYLRQAGILKIPKQKRKDSVKPKV